MGHFTRAQAAVIILVSVSILSLYGWREFSSARHSENSPHPSSTAVVIQVSGKVRSPGTYPFARPVTVGEVLARAGGLAAGLKPQPKWTTLGVEHGRRLQIVADSSGTAHVHLGWMPVPSLLVLGVPLDVNEASAEELGFVPGISRPLAERIVAHRRRLGAFTRLKDLLAVKGIGPVRLKRLRPYLQAGRVKGS